MIDNWQLINLKLGLMAVERLEPYAWKLASTVVCPGKSGMFSRNNKPTGVKVRAL